MNILLFPVGSAGDVHPFVGLGRRLLSRGHEVTVVTNAPFRELVSQAGLGYGELCSEEEFRELQENPDIWHPIKGFSVIARGAILPGMRRQYQYIEEHYQPGNTLAIGSTLSFGARMAHDRLGVPLIGIHLQPAVIWSGYKSPQMGPMLVSDWVPRFFKQFQFFLGRKLILDRVLLGEMNAFRRELGLPSLAGANDFWHAPQKVIGLFPEWYAPPQPDWPEQLELTGFPLWDEREISSMSTEVEDFLDSGSPPIVFTAGSAMVHGHRFFSTAVEACRRINRRAILLTRYPEQIPQDLPDGIKHFDYVPYSQLLPHCAVSVHHGGIGSLSQALAAGVPQLLMPMSHDQPDNAQRLKKLGVADWLKPRAFRPVAVAQSLERLLASEDVKRRCAEVAQRFEGVDGLSQTCDVIEGMMASLTAC